MANPPDLGSGLPKGILPGSSPGAPTKVYYAAVAQLVEAMSSNGMPVKIRVFPAAPCSCSSVNRAASFYLAARRFDPYQEFQCSGGSKVERRSYKPETREHYLP